MKESGKFDNIISKNSKELPSRKYNADVKFICKIPGANKIEKEYGQLKNYDVVLTDERKKHILERRGKEDYNLIMKHMNTTLKKYDYLFKDETTKSKGVVYVKKISTDKHIALFVAVSLTNKQKANSHITGIVLNKKNFKRYLLNRKIIDKK